uniref:Uncharacterized protein n=1 Tax=Trichuris muris TaxID=70415 RepID=A0A5S6Q3C3_TRIMR
MQIWQLLRNYKYPCTTAFQLSQPGINVLSKLSVAQGHDASLIYAFVLYLHHIIPYAPPVYPHYEQEMQIDAQADLNMPVYDFRPQFPTYAPPSSPPCSEEEGPCCCRAAYFNPY